MVKLTPREYDVLIRLHMTTKEIADDLGVSIPTINTMYQVLAKKFNAKSRTGIVLNALRYGVIELGAFF